MLRLQTIGIIKRSGLTVTKMRKKVLSVFLRLKKPLSSNQIQSLVNYIDRVTLFRTLRSFEEKKIIHMISLENGQKLFALCDLTCDKENHNHDHIHFQCDTCNDVSCVPISSFPKFNIPQYQINNVNININGVCVNCN